MIALKCRKDRCEDGKEEEILLCIVMFYTMFKIMFYVWSNIYLHHHNSYLHSPIPLSLTTLNIFLHLNHFHYVHHYYYIHHYYHISHTCCHIYHIYRVYRIYGWTFRPPCALPTATKNGDRRDSSRQKDWITIWRRNKRSDGKSYKGSQRSLWDQETGMGETATKNHIINGWSDLICAALFFLFLMRFSAINAFYFLCSE